MERLDKLGRKIPEFDRSAANKKGAQTKKENYGRDKHSRDGSMGGRVGTRGYFGKLKDEGDTKELKKLSEKGIAARRGHSVPDGTN